MLPHPLAIALVAGLPHFDPRAIADAIGYPAAALGILIESLGIPFPGEIMLVAVAAYAAAGKLDIRLVILFAFAGSVVGTNIGYAIGRIGGRPLVEGAARRLGIDYGHIARAEAFFHRYGDRAIVAGRFVVVFRTWGSMLAGMSRMPFGRFQAYSGAGSLLWAIGIGTLGYLLGHNWPLLESVLKLLGYSGVAVAVIAVLVFIVLRRRGGRRPPWRRR